MPRNRTKRKNKIQNKPFYKIRQNGGAPNNFEELEQLLTGNNKDLYNNIFSKLTNYIKRYFLGLIITEWEIRIHEDIQALLDKGVTIEDISTNDEQLKWLFRLTHEDINNLIVKTRIKIIHSFKNTDNYRTPI